MSKPRISDEDLASAEKYHSAEDHNVHWMAIELRERRSHDRELVRLVKECRESHRLFGEHSSRRVTALLDLLDRIGEANE